MATRTNANDHFSEYIGTENYYKHFGNVKLTDGTKALADKLGAYWLMDIVASYQMGLRSQPFQVWKLEKNKTGNGAKVTCEDGNKNVLRSQRLTFTDFEYDECTLWFQEGVLMLPSEY